MEKNPESTSKDRKTSHLFYSPKKRSESINSRDRDKVTKLNVSKSTNSSATNSAVNSVANSPYGSPRERNSFTGSFNLGDTFSGGASYVANIDEFTDLQTKSNMDGANQAHQLIHSELRDVTRQEKEVQRQIEQYRLDSWHFDAKIKYLKQQLKSLTKESRSNSKSGPKKRLVKTESVDHHANATALLIQATEQQELELNSLQFEIMKHLHDRLLLESQGKHILEKMNEDANMDTEKLNRFKEKLYMLSESNSASIEILKKSLQNETSKNESESGIFEYCVYLNTKDKLSQRKSWMHEDNSTIQKKIETEKKLLEQDTALYLERLSRNYEPIDRTRRLYLVRSHTV